MTETEVPPTDHPARGKVRPNPSGRGVIFSPTGTSYELYLATPAPYAGPVNRPVMGTINLTARKLYTVPSGGNFIAPILGTPRTVQGRVVALTETHAVIHAGVNVRAELPTADGAMDFANGPLEIGARVNLIALPGASYE